MKGKTYTTSQTDKNGRIELSITGFDEPNNGRECWTARLRINERPADNLFRHEWNRLNFRLDQYTFASADEAYIFIPAETESFIICRQTLEVYYMNKVPLSTILFRGNYFYQHKLIVAYRDFFTVYDPEKKEMQEHRFGRQQLVGFSWQEGLFTASLQNPAGSVIEKERFLIL